MEAKDVYFNSVQQFNDFSGAETVHPLVSVVKYRATELNTQPINYHYGLYAVFLKESQGCKIKYGRTKYDFQAMTITSFAPGQMITSLPSPDGILPEWTALVFHPDFLARTHLGKNISSYEFFSYNSNEALHLSDAEVHVIHSVMALIEQELKHSIDNLSRRIVTNNIEVLLNYCLRFYERQFITREEINHSTVKKFEAMLKDYIAHDISTKGVPSVAYFADLCCLSPGYFGELVKTETGRSAQQFIADHLMIHAKELLNDFSLTVTQVSQQLGFEYPQHFVRFFKRHTGVTPTQYRTA